MTRTIGRTLLCLCTLAIVVAAGPAVVKPTAGTPSTDDDPAPSVAPAPPPTPEGPLHQAYGGVLVCQATTVSSSNPNFFMTREEAADAIDTFCGRISSGTVFKSEGGTPLQTTQDDGPYGYPMGLSAVWAPLGRTDCPTTDFSSTTTRAVCKQSLLRNIIDECNTSKRGLQFWKGGGRFMKDCIAWEIRRVGSADPGALSDQLRIR